MENRRLILLLVFTFSLVMLWDAWTKHNQPPHTPNTAQSQPANTGVPSAPQVGQNAVAPAAVIPAAAERKTAPRVTVETDLLRAQISALGGDIVRLELLKHGSTEDPKKPYVIFDDGAQHLYLAQTGLIGEGLPNHNTIFTLPADKLELKEGQDSVALRMEATGANGVKVVKTLTFHRGSYVIDVSKEVQNGGSAPLNTSAYFKLTRDDKPLEQSHGFFGGARTFTGPAFYDESEKFRKVDFKDIANNKAKLPAPADDGWVAMVQHYFVSAFLPASGHREFFVQDVGNGVFSAGVKMPMEEIAPGQKASITVQLYVGPQEQKKLAELAPGFDLVVDYGWLTVIAAPLFWVLSWLYRLVGNWGWAIIALTVLIKLIFFPLSAASYKSMAKMKTLMPRMKRIQEEYKDDRMKMNQEMMELYKREKVNPMGGCWPILVQMPVFIALYWVLLSTVEMRQAPWLGWITDLSVKDPYFILPIIMGVTSLIQVKLNPAPPDPVQAKVMLFMPIFFTIMMAWFPAGLVLYWVVNNLLSIGQQWYITRMFGASASEAHHRT
ncbi:MAG: membrane protein insertase YidC [Betaproteobacteria bacterium]|nr:membrane protein insertase YidC [Betaproteobacteria bacterium]